MIDVNLESKTAEMIRLIVESAKAKDWEMLELRALKLHAMVGDLIAQEWRIKHDPVKDQK